MARSMFVRLVGLVVRVAAIFCLMSLFAEVWRQILWTQWGAEAAYHVANTCGFYGDEAVLDFYADIGVVFSLTLATAIVVLAHRWWKRRVGDGRSGISAN